MSPTTIGTWVRNYKAGGADALVPSVRRGPTRSRDTIAGATHRDAVVEARREHPDWGTRRIRDVLARFEALGVDEHAVRRILHDAGLIVPTTPRVERERLPRRFERAEPNQLCIRCTSRVLVGVIEPEHDRGHVGRRDVGAARGGVEGERRARDHVFRGTRLQLERAPVLGQAARA
jgi:transposase